MIQEGLILNMPNNIYPDAVPLNSFDNGPTCWLHLVVTPNVGQMQIIPKEQLPHVMELPEKGQGFNLAGITGEGKGFDDVLKTIGNVASQLLPIAGSILPAIL